MAIDLLNHGSVISTKWAAKYLKVSYAAFKKEIDLAKNKGIIRYQGRIDDDDSSHPTLGFDLRYLDEILAVIGKERKQGKPVFPPEVLDKIEKINKRWPSN